MGFAKTARNGGFVTTNPMWRSSLKFGRPSRAFAMLVGTSSAMQDSVRTGMSCLTQGHSITWQH